MMNHYHYQQALKSIWSEAVAKYESGNRQPDTYFDPEGLAELANYGLKVMDLYDAAEDWIKYGEPDFETFLMMSEARRDYFLTVQKGQPSDAELDPNTLPAKTDAVRGIEWLPRIIPKAIAKIRGELPPVTMYNCGGDRAFFKAHNIHPAEFLRVAWAYENEPDKIIDWVEARRDLANG
jgi:hypothetical protein